MEETSTHVPADDDVQQYQLDQAEPPPLVRPIYRRIAVAVVRLRRRFRCTHGFPRPSRLVATVLRALRSVHGCCRVLRNQLFAAVATDVSHDGVHGPCLGHVADASAGHGIRFLEKQRGARQLTSACLGWSSLESGVRCDGERRSRETTCRRKRPVPRRCSVVKVCGRRRLGIGAAGGPAAGHAGARASSPAPQLKPRAMRTRRPVVSHPRCNREAWTSRHAHSVERRTQIVARTEESRPGKIFVLGAICKESPAPAYSTLVGINIRLKKAVPHVSCSSQPSRSLEGCPFLLVYHSYKYLHRRLSELCHHRHTLNATGWGTPSEHA